MFSHFVTGSLSSLVSNREYQGLNEVLIDIGKLSLAEQARKAVTSPRRRSLDDMALDLEDALTPGRRYSRSASPNKRRKLEEVPKVLKA